jgi:hypothetical protein
MWRSTTGTGVALSFSALTTATVRNLFTKSNFTVAFSYEHRSQTALKSLCFDSQLAIASNQAQRAGAAIGRDSQLAFKA